MKCFIRSYRSSSIMMDHFHMFDREVLVLILAGTLTGFMLELLQLNKKCKFIQPCTVTLSGSLSH